MRGKNVSRVVALLMTIAVLAPVAQAGVGGGGTPAPIAPVLFPLLCRTIDGDAVNQNVTLGDVYGSREVRIGDGRLLCTLVTEGAGIAGAGVASANAYKCYSLSNAAGKGSAPDSESLGDAFFPDDSVTVGGAQFLCMPAFAP